MMANSLIMKVQALLLVLATAKVYCSALRADNIGQRTHFSQAAPFSSTQLFQQAPVPAYAAPLTSYPTAPQYAPAPTVYSAAPAPASYPAQPLPPPPPPPPPQPHQHVPVHPIAHLHSAVRQNTAVINNLVTEIETLVKNIASHPQVIAAKAPLLNVPVVASLLKRDKAKPVPEAALPDSGSTPLDSKKSTNENAETNPSENLPVEGNVKAAVLNEATATTGTTEMKQTEAAASSEIAVKKNADVHDEATAGVSGKKATEVLPSPAKENEVRGVAEVPQENKPNNLLKEVEAEVSGVTREVAAKENNNAAQPPQSPQPTMQSKATPTNLVVRENVNEVKPDVAVRENINVAAPKKELNVGMATEIVSKKTPEVPPVSPSEVRDVPATPHCSQQILAKTNIGEVKEVTEPALKENVDVSSAAKETEVRDDVFLNKNEGEVKNTGEVDLKEISEVVPTASKAKIPDASDVVHEKKSQTQPSAEVTEVTDALQAKQASDLVKKNDPTQVQATAEVALKESPDVPLTAVHPGIGEVKDENEVRQGQKLDSVETMQKQGDSKNVLDNVSDDAITNLSSINGEETDETGHISFEGKVEEVPSGTSDVKDGPVSDRINEEQGPVAGDVPKVNPGGDKSSSEEDGLGSKSGVPEDIGAGEEMMAKENTDEVNVSMDGGEVKEIDENSADVMKNVDIAPSAVASEVEVREGDSVAMKPENEAALPEESLRTAGHTPDLL